MLAFRQAYRSDKRARSDKFAPNTRSPMQIDMTFITLEDKSAPTSHWWTKYRFHFPEGKCT